MLQALMLPVASKSSQDYGHRIKSAIIPRIPFGDAEKAIILAFGQKYGLKVDFVLARNGIQAADLVANGSVDIASAGIMTAYFAGKGRFMCKQTYEPFSIYLAVDYSPYACEITLQLVLPKRKYVRPYSNLFKPFPLIVWAASLASIFTVLIVRFNHLVKMKPYKKCVMAGRIYNCFIHKCRHREDQYEHAFNYSW